MAFEGHLRTMESLHETSKICVNKRDADISTRKLIETCCLIMLFHIHRADTVVYIYITYVSLHSSFHLTYTISLYRKDISITVKVTKLYFDLRDWFSIENRSCRNRSKLRPRTPIAKLSFDTVWNNQTPD